MKFNHLNVPNHWQHYWTKYPEGYTILEALISWVSQVDDMVDNVNSWNEYLDNFKASFDTDLQETVETVLTEWEKTGFLSEIIKKVTTNRLDEIETDLLKLNTDKVDKDGSGQITWANVGQDVRDRISGATPTAGLGANDVLSYNIANKAVTASKTNFFNVGKNLFDANNVKVGNYGPDGITFYDTSVTFRTNKEFIAVNGGNIYSLSPFSSEDLTRVIEYDGNYQPIKSTDKNVGDSNQITLDNNTRYVMISMRLNILNSFQFENNPEVTDYEPFYTTLDSVKAGRANVQSRNVANETIHPAQTSFFNNPDNLFDKINLTQGKYVNRFTGALGDSVWNYTTDYLPILGNKQIFYGGGNTSDSNNLAFYADKNETSFISGLGDSVVDKVISVPVNANYFRISTHLNNLDKFIVGYGNIVKPYTPHTNVSIKPEFLPNTTNIRKNIAWFGDSISDKKALPDATANLTGATIHDFSISGSHLVYQPGNYGAFSFVAIVEAILNGNYQPIKDGMEATNRSTPTSKIDELANINWNNITDIVLFFGTNDYGGANARIGALGGSDKTQFIPAIEYCFRQLIAQYPHLNFYLFTPIQRFDKQNANTNGFELIDFVNATNLVGDEYSFYVNDLYHNGGINKLNYGYYLLADKLHLTDAGNNLLAEKCANFIINH